MIKGLEAACIAAALLLVAYLLEVARDRGILRGVLAVACGALGAVACVAYLVFRSL